MRSLLASVETPHRADTVPDLTTRPRPRHFLAMLPVEALHAFGRREFLSSALVASVVALRERYPGIPRNALTTAHQGAEMAPFWDAGVDAATLTRISSEQLVQARAAIQSLVDVAGPRTIENTLQPYDDAVRLSLNAAFPSGLLGQVHPDAAVRTAADAAGQQAGVFFTELFQRRDVYNAFGALDVSSADAVIRDFVLELRKFFRFGGADKDEATRAVIQRANEDLTTASQEFNRNINGDRRSVITNRAELEGLPADFIASHPPDSDGRIALTTANPDMLPVLAYARSAALRERMYRAFHSRGHPQNLAVLQRMFAARHASATASGFASYADSATYFNMVGSAQAASDFLDRVERASRTRSEREYAQILRAKQTDEPGATQVAAWDQSYYTEKVRRADYDFDSQSVRPYFPFRSVKQGILDFTSRLFGITYHPVADAPRWHRAVDVLDVREGDRVLGRIYLDLHPRADKYQHTAQFGIRGGVAGRQRPEGALVCNFPGGTEGDPGLMEHGQVRSFFHEFGHVLHEIFSGAGRWFALGGIGGVARDFTEVPSTLLEYWMWDARVLRTFARRHETREPIPEAVVAAMRRAAEFDRGIAARRLLMYARFSLVVDSGDPNVDTDALFKATFERYLPFTFADGTHMQTAFVHLDGYAAGYYTYLWSAVIARDLFSGFDADNLMDAGRARRYRELVLAPGSASPAAELVTRFLGRPYSFEAWRRWLDAGT